MNRESYLARVPVHESRDTKRGCYMKIQLLGHACFYIELKNGIKIITDPYQPECYSGAVRYAPIDLDADIVTVSHSHPDHGFANAVKGAQVINTEKRCNTKDVVSEGIPTYHDKTKGSQRGRNIIFSITAESLKITHFGDLGTLDLEYDKLNNIDIAMIPVGGMFTIDHIEATKLIDTIKPKIAIPMHYKTEKLDFNINTLDKFLYAKADSQTLHCLDVSKETLPSETKIVVLKHQR